MRQIYFLFKGTSTYQHIDCSNDDLAEVLFSDLHNAKLNKEKELYLITGGNTGYKRFIDPRELNDCYITAKGTHE